MFEDIARMLGDLFANPDANRIARWFLGFLAGIVGWALTPRVLMTIDAFTRPGAAIGMARGFISLAGAIGLGIAVAMAVGILAR